MASVMLTVRVKQLKNNTPSDEAQPKSSKGDEEIFTLKNILASGKFLSGIFALKGVSTAINVIKSETNFFLYTTGDSYAQEMFNVMYDIKNIKKRLNLYERYKWSRQTNYDLMWENRSAEQAARRSGNYLTGNSR